MHRRFFNFNNVELVKIGQGSAGITRVIREQLDFTNEAGEEISIDLIACARVWAMFDGELPDKDFDWVAMAGIHQDFDDIDVSGGGAVGMRGAADEPPWFQFMDWRRTQFEFKDYDTIYAELLNPMGQAGWQSFDAS